MVFDFAMLGNVDRLKCKKRQVQTVCRKTLTFEPDNVFIHKWTGHSFLFKLIF
jgi:hypothetical protein